MSKTIVGVFGSHDQAEQAINALRERGFGDNEISLVAKDDRTENQKQEYQESMSYEDQELGDGTATGGVLGGLAGLMAGVGALVIPGLGPIVAAGPISGVLAGAVTGGVAGGLVDYGVPEERGEFYEQRVKEGDVLLLLDTNETKSDEAQYILREYDAQNVESHQRDDEDYSKL